MRDEVNSGEVKMNLTRRQFLILRSGLVAAETSKPGFAEGVRELQKAGVRVMPYINGRLWDTRAKGMEDDQFRRRLTLPAYQALALEVRAK
jgi:hypothetical protein